MNMVTATTPTKMYPSKPQRNERPALASGEMIANRQCDSEQNDANRNQNGHKNRSGPRSVALRRETGRTAK
jgi:hypothetical protein